MKNSRTTLTKRKPTRIPRSLPLPPIKYFDFYTFGSASTTVAFGITTLVPQGVGQSHRTVDTVFLERIDARIILTCSTTDVTNLLRISLFFWHPNSNSLTPSSDSYYESPSTFGVSTPLNFEGRKQYTTLMDTTVSLVGTNSAPTNLYQRILFFKRNINNRIDFNEGLTSGYNHIYLSHFSDSAVTPFPQVSYFGRIWYRDAQ